MTEWPLLPPENLSLPRTQAPHIISGTRQHHNTCLQHLSISGICNFYEQDYSTSTYLPLNLCLRSCLQSTHITIQPGALELSTVELSPDARSRQTVPSVQPASISHMPKLPKAFGRRKSTTNALEEPFAEIPLNQQTFKVFERRDTGKSIDAGGKFRPGRPSLDPEKDDNIFSGFSNRYVSLRVTFAVPAPVEMLRRICSASVMWLSLECNATDLAVPASYLFMRSPAWC